MITLFEESVLKTRQFDDRFTATKIEAGFLSYGCKYPFFTIWEQKLENCLTAVLCKYESTFFIVANEKADIKELKEFIFAVGFASLQGHSELIKKLQLPNFKEYVVLCKRGSKEMSTFSLPPIQKIYEILYSKENSDIKHFDYIQFYADLSHRFRHKTASAVIFNNASVALASHITNDSAVISGVATLESKRSLGYASKALNEIGKLLCNKMIFVASTLETSSFYIKNGFKEFSNIAIYETEEI